MYKTMIFNIYSVCFIVVFFQTINTLPYYRYRRQINLPNRNDPFYGGPSVRTNDPSGSITGTSYYHVGSDPNYGSFISKPNRPSGHGIRPISYNSNSHLYGNLINPNHKHQQQQQQNYLYNRNNNNNNVWQRPNRNNNYNPLYNPYASGVQGWYADGSNRWYNNGQSIMAHPYLLMITIAILFFCK